MTYLLHNATITLPPQTIFRPSLAFPYEWISRFCLNAPPRCYLPHLPPRLSLHDYGGT
jgi:hypothetical protein